jgi:hypothetical protein
MMQVLELMGEVNAKHLLQAQVPEALRPGPVRIIMLIPEAEDAGAAWRQGITPDWAAELSDPREDIYTLEDGKPLDTVR